MKCGIPIGKEEIDKEGGYSPDNSEDNMLICNMCAENIMKTNPKEIISKIFFLISLTLFCVLFLRKTIEL
jgi:hypothetical protein